jgi:hypothetical protein
MISSRKKQQSMTHVIESIRGLADKLAEDKKTSELFFSGSPGLDSTSANTLVSSLNSLEAKFDHFKAYRKRCEMLANYRKKYPVWTKSYSTLPAEYKKLVQENINYLF